jgi:predicted RNA-binding Zn-ribbon protein involved in translation (DUF1610 family)
MEEDRWMVRCTGNHRKEYILTRGDTGAVGYLTKAYCVKCKKSVEMKDPKKVKLKNGKPATKGLCPKCGTKVFRIGG